MPALFEPHTQNIKQMSLYLFHNPHLARHRHSSRMETVNVRSQPQPNNINVIQHPCTNQSHVMENHRHICRHRSTLCRESFRHSLKGSCSSNNVTQNVIHAFVQGDKHPCTDRCVSNRQGDSQSNHERTVKQRHHQCIVQPMVCSCFISTQSKKLSFDTGSKSLHLNCGVSNYHADSQCVQHTTIKQCQHQCAVHPMVCSCFVRTQ